MVWVYRPIEIEEEGCLSGAVGEASTLDFGWGRDLRVVRSNPSSGSVLREESAILSSSPVTPPPAHGLALSLSLFLSKRRNQRVNCLHYKKVSKESTCRTLIPFLSPERHRN